MTTTSRQSNLILNQDWTRIYQTFKNADFKSYDFENLRRVIITYLRENYPEDFNDYIESSEYLALIDAIAFLGQSLSFRIDLASRENFIELAERKESVLRLARMLGYNSKRNLPSQGLLKFDTVSTTEAILDSNGKNLSQQVIIWNDPTNTNWAEQFITVLNAAMTDNVEFGRSQGSAIISGIQAEQYRFRTASADVPVFSFSKSVAGRQMVFELVSTSFKDAEEIYEESPVPGNQLGFVYRNDGKGGSSANTGFYLLFKQGSLELADFNIEAPSTNEVVAVDSNNINENDVWLFQLNSSGAQLDQWTKVQNLIGNNIAFNSINSNIRNIYSITTKENDRIDLLFADGVYGNLPQGPFRVYYRISNGLIYQISPSDMRGVTIAVPYINKQGILHTLTITMSLKYTVSSSAASESTDQIRFNAPAQYYTQNRMITAEDYNLAPLTSSQDILKVRAINRTSSGISRNFDIIDASGKYSSVNVFGDDGIIYKTEEEKTISFKFVNRFDIVNFIKGNIEPLFTNTEVYNYYLTKYEKILFSDKNTLWKSVSSDINLATGYFVNAVDPSNILKTGTYTSNTLKYVFPGSLIRFDPPTGYAFKRGQLVVINPLDPEQKNRQWTKVVKITGDGTNAGRGVLSSGLGSVQLSDPVPNGAIATRVVPKFVNNLSNDLEAEIVNLVFSNLNFGLRYDYIEGNWKLITSANLNLVGSFSLGKSGDSTNSNLDSSWLVAFVKVADEYLVRVRGLDYIFGSLEQNRFYYDSNRKVYDSKTGKVVKDQIRILGINTDKSLITPLKEDIVFNVDDSIKFDDGYQSVDEIKIAFSDSDDDGVIDNPEAFEMIVGPDADLKFLFFREIVNDLGNKLKVFVDNTDNNISIVQKESLININDYANGKLIYFYDSEENVVKRVNRFTNTLEIEPDYIAAIGRDDLKFQYIHTADSDRRIDPSSSNIMDVYLLTRSYDRNFRNFLSGAVNKKPEPPNSDSLRISFGSKLNSIKSISDEVVYHPVSYKVLFGPTADTKLQAIFKVVKNSNKLINDNDLKVRIISAINEFFDINNWDFGDRFYASELITYVVSATAPDISNIVLVPRQPSQVFGSLFEIQSRVDEVFVSGATVDDISIVSAISAAEIRANAESVISNTNYS
jgi:hypothetical protein